jgi:hypothetical protein
LFDVGTLPSSGFGAEVQLGAVHGPIEVSAIAGALQSSLGTLATRPAEGASFSALHAGARSCFRNATDWVHFGPCAGVAEEWTLAHGFGSSSPSNADGASFVLLGSMSAEARLAAHVDMDLRAEAVVPLVRPLYVIDHGGTVFQPGLAAFRAAAGVTLLF